MTRHREKMSIYNPRRGSETDPSFTALGWNQTCWHLNLGPWFSRTWRPQISVVEGTHFVTVALENKYMVLICYKAYKLCFITYILLWKTLFVFKTSGSTQEYIHAFMLFVICTVIEKKKKTQHPVKANFRRFLWLRKNTVTLQQESPTGNIF